MKQSKSLMPFLCLGLMQLIAGGCDYDHGIDPIRTKLKGNIIFTGAYPGNVTEARLVVVKNLPPVNLTTDVIFSEPLPFSRGKLPGIDDTLRYELVVEAGIYPIAGVLWRPQGGTWDIANIIGLYLKFNPINFTIDTEIEVSQPPGAEGINITANWDLAKRDAQITGVIDFKGAWRDDTDFFALGCYSKIPQNSIEYLTELLAGNAAFQLVFQSTPVDSLRYTIDVNSQAGDAAEKGKYHFIALFWKGKAASLSDIRAIGFYRCDNDTLLPRVAASDSASTTSGIDFSADFSKLPVGAIYRSVAAPCP